MKRDIPLFDLAFLYLDFKIKSLISHCLIFNVTLFFDIFMIK